MELIDDDEWKCEYERKNSIEFHPLGGSNQATASGKEFTLHSLLRITLNSCVHNILIREFFSSIFLFCKHRQSSSSRKHRQWRFFISSHLRALELCVSQLLTLELVVLSTRQNITSRRYTPFCESFVDTFQRHLFTAASIMHAESPLSCCISHFAVALLAIFHCRCRISPFCPQTIHLLMTSLPSLVVGFSTASRDGEIGFNSPFVIFVTATTSTTTRASLEIHLLLAG